MHILNVISSVLEATLSSLCHVNQYVILLIELLGPHNATKSLAAEALPQTSLGELTALHQTS